MRRKIKKEKVADTVHLGVTVMGEDSEKNLIYVSVRTDKSLLTKTHPERIVQLRTFKKFKNLIFSSKCTLYAHNPQLFMTVNLYSSSSLSTTYDELCVEFPCIILFIRFEIKFETPINCSKKKNSRNVVKTCPRLERSNVDIVSKFQGVTIIFNRVTIENNETVAVNRPVFSGFFFQIIKKYK